MGICIRQEAGMCCIQYSPCSDTNSCAFDNKEDADTKIGTNCSQDYVEISGVLGQCNSQSEAFLLDKLCGEIFGFVDTNAIAAQLVCDFTAPFAVNFITNAIAEDSTGGLAQRGFCLEYKQVAC